MELLQAKRAIEIGERAGEFDKAAMLDVVKADLDALYLACVSRWQDL